ncbi:type VI secretion system TssO [Halpernia frigidisoli]|uniref:Uncharacterized protein n=1 Tax=Halpernia frigidisoli TaxID=1125876 RepID=A0A1I3IPD2_9FLAO|nr:type VI secretion system TssO [Halpernia frigidisoli]SFI49717.1 hypothetical protein SAMN05443292_2717 [Halpernia frigidisoli]
MQVNITLSNKEKRHYFLYLLGMMLITILILSVITLRKFSSPFSDADLHSVLVLQEKSKFDEAQKSMQKTIDSTFVKLDKLDPEKYDPIKENDIDIGISDIGNAFKITSVTDPRQKGYAKIANFYKMYQLDKQDMHNTAENVVLFKQQYDNCLINVKEKSQQMYQRENAMIMHNGR